MLIDHIRKGIEELARREFRKLLKITVLAAVGLIFVSLGFVYLGISAVEYLSFTIPSWLAWAMVGLTTALLGLIFLLWAFLQTRS